MRKPIPFRPIFCGFAAGCSFGPAVLLSMLGAPPGWSIAMAIVGIFAFAAAMEWK